MKKVFFYIGCLLGLTACIEERESNPFCDTLRNHVEEFIDSVHENIFNVIFFRKDNKDYAYIHNAYYFDTLHTDYYIETERGHYYRRGEWFSNKKLITVSFDTYINHQDVFDATKAIRYDGKPPGGWPVEADVFDGHGYDKVFLIKSKDCIQIVDSISPTNDDGHDNLSSYINNPYLAEELKSFITHSETVLFYLVFVQYEGNNYILIDGSRSFTKKHLKGFFFYQTELVLCYSSGDLYKNFVNPNSLIIPYNGIIPGYKEGYETGQIYNVFKIDKDGRLHGVEDLDLRRNVIYDWEHSF